MKLQYYEDVVREAVCAIQQSGLLDRIVSIDLETKVLDEGQFLSGEIVLGAAASWFESGKATTKVLVLKEEADERSFFANLDLLIRSKRPLAVVGYNHTRYDLPLLSIKLQQLGKPTFWAIQDMISGSLPVDMLHFVKFELAKESKDGILRPQSLAKVVEHPIFSSLPLMRTKKLLPTNQSKGPAIYEMWKNDTPGFERYVAGDAHDVLQIFGQIFLKILKTQNGLSR